MIHKAGLLTIRDNRILLCRKKGRAWRLILPGGKIEAGETPLQCLLRELREELGKVRVEGLDFVGTYSDIAAGEKRRIITIELYTGVLIGKPKPQAEIGELVWFGESDDRAQLAPSLSHKIIPDVIARGLLDWK